MRLGAMLLDRNGQSVLKYNRHRRGISKKAQEEDRYGYNTH